MLNQIFVVDSLTLTSTGTAVSTYTPWDQSTRKLPTQVVVKATGQGAYVRLSNDASAATNADVLVQGGDHVVLSVQGRRWVSVLSNGASSTVNVGALSTGVSGSAASLDLAFVDAGVLDPRVTFTRASTATYFDSAGVLTSAAINTPRLDYNPSTLAAQGLLIEEQRTNSIRNNTMQGGGSGVEPTNWTANGTTGNGITLTVVGVGIENGIAYVDYEINGTATITGTAVNIVFDTTTAIAASATQVWAWSSYLKLAAGTLTNLTFTPRVSWRDSGGGAITSNDGTSVPTSAGLATQRFSFSATAPASTGYVQPQLRIGTVNGSTYTGVQIRIGLPQLELGAFATSVIPTTVAAVTRSADVASVNTLSPWFNATESTLYLEFTPVGMKSVGGTALVSIDNGATATERIALIAASNNGMQNITTVAGSTSGNSQTPATIYAANTTYKIAMAVKLNDIQSFANGVAGTVGTTALMPSGLTNLQFNKTYAIATSNNGWIRRFTYYPRKLSAAEGQAITV